MGQSDGFAFALCLMVTVVDTLGTMFLHPSVLPYGLELGADLTTVNFSHTVRAVGNGLSLVIMPLAASKYGRRRVIVGSVLGSTVGYFVQGGARVLPERLGLSDGTGIAAFVAGRAIAGVFGATSAVLQGAVVDLSRDDAGQVDEAKLVSRTNLLFAAFYVPGGLMSFAGGLLALVRLNVPALVAGVAGGVVFVLTLVGLRLPASSDAPETRKERPPCDSLWDPVLVFEALCFGAVTFTLYGMYLIILAVLVQPGFELLGTSDDPSRKLAFTAGLTCSCFVLTTLVASIAVMKFVQDGWGVPVALLGAIGNAVGIVLLGFAEQTWHAILLTLCIGAFAGMFMPGVMPAVTAYVEHRHGHNKDMAFTMIKFGEMSGTAVSHVSLGAILGDDLPSDTLRETCFAAAAVFLFGTLGHLVNLLLNMQAKPAQEVNEPPAVAARTTTVSIGRSTEASSVVNSIAAGSIEVVQSTYKGELGGKSRPARRDQRVGTMFSLQSMGRRDSMPISRRVTDLSMGSLPPLGYGM